MNLIRKFMYGRYGADQLTFSLLALYLAFYLISTLTGWWPLYLLSMAFILFAFFRMMSRNITKRREENSHFLSFFAPVIRWFKTRRTMHRDRDHCYFKCPNCGQHLRVPKGKGRITVTCRACGVSFEEKS